MTERKWHLFEFEDLPWLPKVFRSCITDLLTYQINHLGIYSATISKISEILNKTGHDTIVDLCSGSGGPAPFVRNELSQALDREIKLVLTDKYPNLKAFEAAKTSHSITSIAESVDATQVLPHLKGMRTMFTAFHHFKPKEAQQILKNVAHAQMPIAIFEITERTPISFLTLIIAPITCLIFSLMIRPRTLSRFFWTYLIPVIPFIYTWDGLISNLRTYKKQEWLEMTRELDHNGYTWEVGEVISRFHIKVSYLIGYPKNRKETSHVSQ